MLKFTIIILIKLYFAHLCTEVTRKHVQSFKTRHEWMETFLIQAKIINLRSWTYSYKYDSRNEVHGIGGHLLSIFKMSSIELIISKETKNKYSKIYSRKVCNIWYLSVKF